MADQTRKPRSNSASKTVANSSYMAAAKASAVRGPGAVTTKATAVTKAAPINAVNATASEVKAGIVGACIDVAKDSTTGVDRLRLTVSQWADSLGKFDKPEASKRYGASLLFSGSEPWHTVMVTAAARRLATKGHPLGETFGAVLDALDADGNEPLGSTLAMSSKFDEETRKAATAQRKAADNA